MQSLCRKSIRHVVVGNLPMLIWAPTLITCSVVCHTEAHDNLRLVHNTKPARYDLPFQYNAGLWQTDRHTDRHVAIANTSLIRADESPGLCSDHFVILRSREHSTVPVLSLGEPSKGEHWCGGTVVGPWRLTRGHESDWKPVASPQDQSSPKTREKSGRPPSCYKNCVVHRS